MRSVFACMVLAAAGACGRIGFVATDVATETCSNGVADDGETAIDCGGVCPLECVSAPCLDDAQCITETCRERVCEPAPLRWQPGPALTVARAHLACVAFNSELLCLGGSDINNVPSAVVDALPFGGAQFEARPDLLTPRTFHDATVAGDAVYIHGGSDMAAALDTLEIVRATTRSTANPSPTKHQAHQFVTGSDGKLHVFDNAGDNTYTPSSDSWLTNNRLPSPTPRDQACAVVRGGEGLLIAGRSSMPPANDVEAYAFAAGTWRMMSPLAAGRQYPNCALGADGRVHLVGGLGASGVVTTNEVFDVDRDRWIEAAPSLTPREAHAMAVGDDGRLYVAGGFDTTGALLDTTEVYGPTLVALTALSSESSARIRVAGHVANSRLTIAVDGLVIALASADDSGIAEVDIELPVLTMGFVHELSARDVRSQYPSRLAFTP